MSDGRKQLPDDLLKGLLNSMTKAGAYIASNGDSNVMNSYKDQPSIFMLLLLTAALLLVTYIVAEMSNYYNIRQNWAHFRCMPSVTPFSKFYGHDLAENVNFCISQSVREHAPGVIDPLYRGINTVTGIVDGVYGKVVSIESGVSGLLSGFSSFVINFANSFRLVGTRVRMSFIRVKEIFARVYGTFIAFSYAAISAITFGENLVCNPLVVFLGTITGVDICCFAPQTRIRMADGSIRPIADINIGDRLGGSAEVCSMYQFTGAFTEMVRINGVHVSTNHYLRGPDGNMVQAGNHPCAVRAERIGKIWCLGTTNNTIPIVTDAGDAIYTDYEESSDPVVIAEAQRIAEDHLNAGAHGEPVHDYSLGLDPTLQVLMKNGSWKCLHRVTIGDELSGGGHVTGTIREVCKEQVRTPGGHYISAAQLVFYGGRWVRATYVWPPAGPCYTGVLYHLMVAGDAPITVGGDGETLVIRDYAEIASEDIQEPYTQKLRG